MRVVQGQPEKPEDSGGGAEGGCLGLNKAHSGIARGLRVRKGRLIGLNRA